MALTFKILNGDTEMNNITGKPRLVGNDINENDSGKARNKAKQDLLRGLSLAVVRNGTTANIQSLVGTISDYGPSTIGLLINKQIRDMFSSILAEQRKRLFVRPKPERFASIIKLLVLEDSKTNYRFKLAVKMEDQEEISINGSMG